MNIKKIIISIVISCLCSVTTSYAMNGLRTYESLLRVDPTDKPWQINILTESSLEPAKGFNSNGCPVNILHIYSDTQDALAMLKGFDPNSAIGQLNMRVDANDNGIRGNLVFDGKLRLNIFTAFQLMHRVTPHWGFSFYFTFESMQLSDFSVCDLTQSITEDDFRVKQYLTNNLCGIVKQLGGLELGNWKRIGPGDLLSMVTWQKTYPQYRPMLKNVALNGRLGLLLPTGKRKDEDKVFAFPFGYDGAVGLLFGGGLDAQLGDYFKVGFDVQLLHLFGNTRERRIKTDVSQTAILLLEKTAAYKDFGMYQRFNLYFEFYHFLKETSLLVGYEFNKHGDDVLSLNCLQFASEVANSTATIKDWTGHLIVLDLKHNFSYLVTPQACVIPQVCLFFRLPFEGRRSVLFPTVGGRIVFDF